jgi:hypothetical protein
MTTSHNNDVLCERQKVQLHASWNPIILTQVVQETSHEPLCNYDDPDINRMEQVH